MQEAISSFSTSLAADLYICIIYIYMALSGGLDIATRYLPYVGSKPWCYKSRRLQVRPALLLILQEHQAPRSAASSTYRTWGKEGAPSPRATVTLRASEKLASQAPVSQFPENSPLRI